MGHMSKSYIDQFGEAKKKNGHKPTCSCHICENIKNKAKRGGYEEEAEKEQLKKMGGSKKKNGHKPNCNCIICKNMKNSKKKIGGSNNEIEDIKNNKDKTNNIIYKKGCLFNGRTSSFICIKDNLHKNNKTRKRLIKVRKINKHRTKNYRNKTL